MPLLAQGRRFFDAPTSPTIAYRVAATEGEYTKRKTMRRMDCAQREASVVPRDAKLIAK